MSPRKQNRPVRLIIRLDRVLASPKRDFVKNREQNRATPNLTIAVRRNRNVHAALKLKTKPRHARHHAGKLRDRLEKRADITKNDLALIAVTRKTLNNGLLARAQLADVALFNRRRKDGKQRGDAVLPASSTAHHEKLAHALQRRIATARKRAERDKLLTRQRQCESALQDDAPVGPAIAAEPSSEADLLVAHRLDDVHHGAHRPWSRRQVAQQTPSGAPGSASCHRPLSWPQTETKTLSEPVMMRCPHTSRKGDPVSCPAEQAAACAEQGATRVPCVQSRSSAERDPRDFVDRR